MIEFITSPAYNQQLVQAIQQMVGDAGMTVEISTTDKPTFLKLRQGKPETAGGLAIGAWSCACQDADGVIFPLFRTGSVWANIRTPPSIHWWIAPAPP